MPGGGGLIPSGSIPFGEPWPGGIPIRGPMGGLIPGGGPIMIVVVDVDFSYRKCGIEVQ